METCMQVLLVDDEEGFRRPLVRRLDKRGANVREASSGEEALLVLASEPVDVVVLDVRMPGMGGMEALERIKRDYPRVEAILLTGHASVSDGIAGIKQGAFDYLTKPIEFEHLFGKITQAYDKTRREKEKAREAEFRAKMEQQMVAAERLASLGTLAAGVAHEINNPLAIIQEAAAWMKLLIEKPDAADAPYRPSCLKALEKVQKSVDRAKRITHQLLGFARKTESIVMEVDLADLADEVARLVDREARNKNVILSTESTGEGTVVWSDPNQLRQVLVNLVTNAIQATGAGGRVTIALEGDDSEARIRVRDTGCGIARENLERVFEPFFTTKPPGEGTGLGLSVSRGIIEKLGGHIEVQSRVGEGTIFCASLPKLCRIGIPRNGEGVDWRTTAKDLERR